MEFASETCLRRDTSLVPANIVLRHDPPGTVVLTVDIVASHPKLKRCGPCQGWQVADIVGFAEIVPCYDLDDVRLHCLDGLVPAMGEQNVRVLDPGVVVAIVEVFELPG